MKSLRNTLHKPLSSGAAALLAFALALSSCVGAKGNSDKEALSLLTILALSSSNRSVEFVAASSSSASAMQAEGMALSAQGLSASTANKTNLAGRRIADYGDGTSDGYQDKFLTPEKVGIAVSPLLLWKRPDLGGPPHGQEKYDNATILEVCEVMDPNSCSAQGQELSRRIQRSSPTIIPIGKSYVKEQQVMLFNAVTDYVIEAMLAKIDSSYDRIGFAINGVAYNFTPQQMGNSNIRFVQILFQNHWANEFHSWQAAPPSWIANASAYVTVLPPTYEQCNAQDRPFNFAFKNGSSLGYPPCKEPDPFTVPQPSILLSLSDSLMPPMGIDPRTGYFRSFSVANYTNLLAYEPPEYNSQNHGKPEYLLVKTVDPKTLDGGFTIKVEVDATNVFFWDSNSNSASFSPTEWPQYTSQVWWSGNDPFEYYLDASCVSPSSSCYPAKTPPAPTNPEAPDPANGKDLKIHLPVIDLEIIPEGQ